MPLSTRHSLNSSSAEKLDQLDLSGMEPYSELDLGFSELSTPCDIEKNEEEDEDEENLGAPSDNFNFMFIAFFYFGCSSLISWNMFITVSFDYYESYKLQYNATATWYSDNFQNAMTICSQIPDFLFCVLGIFLDLRGNLPRRMQFSIVFSVLTLLATMVFVYVPTDTWLLFFFIFTLLTVIVLNSAIGVFDNSLFGLVSTFPFKYTLAVVTGQNFNGILITVLSIVSKIVSDNVHISSLVFFGIAVFVKLGCLVILKLMQKNDYFLHYGVLKKSQDASKNEETTIWRKLFEAFKKGKWQFLNIFICMFVTFAVFPNITLYIRDEPLGQPYSFFVPEKFYNDVVTFLNFSLFSFSGSLLANSIQWPGPSWIWLPVWARIWFLIYFPLCNYQPEQRKIEVIFTSTWMFISGQAMMAFSCGYLSSIIMMYAPKTCKDPELQRLAGMSAYICLLIGCIGGLVFSWVIKIIVLN